MAKVERNEVVELVETKVPVVTLTLSEEEALTLQLVLAYVGGNPVTTSRGSIDSIFEGLKDAGLDYTTHKAYGLAIGSILFN